MTEPNYALSYIEIDVDRCSLTYGTAPCTASIPTTGDIKCFNSLGTCQDRANFDNVPVTLRFAEATSWLPSDIEIEAASIESVSYSPAVISLGEDMGQRASLTVTFKDHRHSDTGPGGDNYLADRDYNPFETGTYWGKFRTRNPFQRGRSIRWIQGLLGEDIADMETRHFVIESFDFDALAGKFTITAKDTLKLADGDRAQAPLLSPGFLSANINNVVTAATLSPAGIGNTDYPASGYLNIGGKEIVSFTRVADALTITRAQFNSEAVAHNSGDRLQLCLHYNAEDPANVIADLFENYAAIDAAYIPVVDWLAETEAFYRRVVTALIAEPTPVKTLVSELIQQCGLAIWWDDVGEEIRLQVLRAISTTAETFNDSNVAEGTLQAREQPGKRISQVWCYFGILNPLKGVSDPDNFRSTAIRVDLDAEEDYGQPAIKKIFSRWIPFGGLTIADRVTAIQLGRFRTAPRHFAFELYRRGAETPVLGEGCRLFGLPMQDSTGALADVPIQITRLNPDVGVYQVEAEEQLFVDLDNEDPNVHPIIIDSNTFDVDLRDLHDTLFGTLDNGVTVNVTVNAGVIVGSTSTSTPALDIGTWPTQAVTGNRTSGSPILSGLSVDTATWAAVGQRVFGTGIPAGAKILTVDSSSQITLDANASSGGTSTALTVHTVIINLLLRGRIQGKGGTGGQGGTAFNTTAGDGSPGGAGGSALLTTYSVNLLLDVGDAEVWGGAGGGGGGSAGAAGGYARGNGGGGGAGANPGAGGAAGGSGSGEDPGDPGTTEAGGNGGHNAFDGGYTVVDGGDGGGPGLAGAVGGSFGSGYDGGAAGSAGSAINGITYIDKTGTGDIRGNEV